MKKYCCRVIILSLGLLVCLSALAKLPAWTLQKQDFVGKIVSSVEVANEGIRTQRQALLGMFKQRGHQSMSSQQQQWVQGLAKRYALRSFNLQSASQWQQLIQRVDTIPPSLAVAQAITESAWGRSRFAREANNYYGVWCFTKGCGLVPKQRRAGATFEVRSYASVMASVRSYMHNLNTNRAYRELRALRAQMRQQGKVVSGVDLANGLAHYSARGEAYVKGLQTIIRNYDFSSYDRMTYTRVS
jgi:Bax protein